MKKKIAYITILYTIFFTMEVGITQDGIPPYNKMLFKLYPDIQVRFPQVPRISAQEALLAYRNGTAFFLGGGHNNSAVPGGLYFVDLRKIDIDRLKAKFLRNNRLLIVY